MVDREGDRQAWTTHDERGHAAAIRLIVWIALHLGRTATRLLLYPICLYFLIFSAASRAASGAYLRRVLGRPPRFVDRFRHYHCFAACVLDRVYLLNNQIGLFDLRVQDEAVATAELAHGRGCFLFGAHLGSFEVLRALGHQQKDIKLSLVMYEENAQQINLVLDAINPNLALEIIALGQLDSMITVERRLDQGHFIGILADRSLPLKREAHLVIDFLGGKARFPLGPFHLAAVLKRSIILMIGLYRGGRRYEVYFERLADFSELRRDARPEEVENAVRLYVARLEHFCRLAPYNWFNFYEFWE